MTEDPNKKAPPPLPKSPPGVVKVEPRISTLPTAPAGPAMGPRVSMIELDWLNEDTHVTRTTETNILVPAHLHDKSRGALVLITGLNAGQVFTVDDRETIIGRSRDAHVRIDDVGISRTHTRVVRGLDGRFLVEDMGSTNGTFVGGVRVQRVELHSGDQVQIGPNVVLRFTVMDEAEESLARQLYESSTRDALTRAWNRKYFVERLQSEVAYANRHRTRLGILLFDLDHFKKVNDTHGHLAGDEVLRAVSREVAKLIRVEDVFARFGGEEFVILVRGIELTNIALFAERVRRSVERLVIAWEKLSLRQTVSIGVAALSECGPEPTSEALLQLADERLYRAKGAGRNQVAKT
ncbi:MAG: GGDEF domain-containing protein [Polyangiaceae bacterium]